MASPATRKSGYGSMLTTDQKAQFMAAQMIGAGPGQRIDPNDISLEDMDRNQQTRKAIRERREMKNKNKKPMTKRGK